MAVKTTRITVKRDTIMLIRHARTEQAWCPVCGGDVEVVTLEREDLLEFLAANGVREWIAAGRLHASRELNGPIRICLDSLLRCFEP